jgi:hypothetical protein
MLYHFTKFKKNKIIDYLHNDELKGKKNRKRKKEKKRKVLQVL